MPSDLATVIMSLLVGLALAAACGFRVFVPLLVAGIAAKAGQIQLAPGFGWMSSTPAIAAFAVATALEIGAYYIPWLDNLLDTVATPAAIVAGILVTAGALNITSPLLRWALAVIVGGGAAGTVQAATTVIRTLSTAATAGTANPGVSTAEAGFSLGISVLAVLIPIAAAVVVLLIMLAALRFIRRLFRRRGSSEPKVTV
ncbi:MAG: DUF4126 domain-containing protein [Planctomycetota bacterium]|jgi:hypothetical protein